MPMGSYICVTCRSIYDRDQESWLVKIVLDNLIAPFQCSWSLDFTGVQRTKCSHASLVSKKVRWSGYSEFILIPWSAPKNNVDHLIPFWSRLQTLLPATCELSIQQPAHHSQLHLPACMPQLFNVKNSDSKWLLVDCLSRTTAYFTMPSVNNTLYNAIGLIE